jgi:hypothetical protein
VLRRPGGSLPRPLAEASVSRSSVNAPGRRPEQARAGPALGALASGQMRAQGRDAVSSPAPWMPVGPAPCFWRGAGRSARCARHLLGRRRKPRTPRRTVLPQAFRRRSQMRRTSMVQRFRSLSRALSWAPVGRLRSYDPGVRRQGREMLARSANEPAAARVLALAWLAGDGIVEGLRTLLLHRRQAVCARRAAALSIAIACARSS